MAQSAGASRSILRDRTNADAMFDCLVELELLARDAITDHSIVELLRTNPMSMQEELPLSTAA